MTASGTPVTFHQTFPPSSIIELCIGGDVFTTQRSTLMKYDFFRLLLATRNALMVTEDMLKLVKTGGAVVMICDKEIVPLPERYFVDRSPTYFSYILQYLRTGVWPKRLPKNYVQEELAAECAFYGLPMPPNVLTPEQTQQVASWLACKRLEIFSFDGNLMSPKSNVRIWSPYKSDFSEDDSETEETELPDEKEAPAYGTWCNEFKGLLPETAQTIQAAHHILQFFLQQGFSVVRGSVPFVNPNAKQHDLSIHLSLERK